MTNDNMRPAAAMRAGIRLAATVVAGVGLGLSLSESAGAVDLDFVTHIDAGMYEQDVFVELPDSKGRGVFRVGPNNYQRVLGAAAFATTRTVHHDPGNADAAGPYPMGSGLGMSLGDWLAGTGSGTYTCERGIGRISASFEDLVPDGVYTIWYFFVPTPAAEPFSTYDLPLGDRAGRENAFFADAKGNAQFELTMSSCLQGSGTQLAAGLAVAWHSDGATYGSNPGGFGRATHVQLFLLLPPDEELNG
ncbi:MAG: hypothetical protein O7A03_06495 [Alphaproteobacteria bacterium]|nr:hypothetical protein [Alphaproteobacteria bacterium]